MMKRILIKVRTSLKFLILISAVTFVTIGIFMALYKPIYSVSLNGEIIGYCEQKSRLQAKIDEHIEAKDKTIENVAFVQIEEMPTYNLCLLKRGIVTNDDEIYQKVIEKGTEYYKYYAILEENEEKFYVSDFEKAENVVKELSAKESTNINDIEILEKYSTELIDFSNTEEIIASLYKEKVVQQPIVVASKSKKSSSSFTTSTNISKSKVNLGISLIKPITGTITSRFGSKSSIRSGAHTGLDISASTGTPIRVASSGTVTWAGYKGSYGYLVVVSHSNGIQTYYGHCSKLYVSSGQEVTQGDTIAAVGSTGNSTGPHLHLEIRVNGVAYNPQNYVY